MRTVLTMLAALCLLCVPLGSDASRPVIRPGATTTWTPLIPPEFAGLRGEEPAQSQAASAKEMVRLTWLQIWIAFLGALGLLISLEFTRRSLRQTRLALRHAEETSQRQLRAYLEIRFNDVVRIELGDETAVRIRYKLRNRGQTPARSIRAKMWLVGVSDFAWDVPITRSEREVIAHSTDLGPDSESLIFLQLAGDHAAKAEAAFAHVTERLLLWIHVDYVDAFGAAQWTRFSCFIRGEPPKEEHTNPSFIGGS